MNQSTTQMHTCCSTRLDQAFIDAVNTALEELKADGTIKELSEEYLDGDYVPE